MFCESFWSKLKAHRGAKWNNRHVSWLYCSVVGLSEAATRDMVQESYSLKFCNIHRKHLCWSLFFKKLQTFRPATLLKRDPPLYRCFPVNIAKFLILPILKNICKHLLFNSFNGSLLHGPIGLRSRLYDSVRLQGLSHRSSFCF